MDFSFTEEQEMLRKIARDFLSTECPKDLVRKIVKDEKGYTPELWGKMAELGWMGLVIPEKYGGIEGSFLDVAVLLEEMGRAALPGPFFPTLIGSLAILEVGSEEQKKGLLPKIAQGKLVLTLAVSEPDVGYELNALQCQATADGKEYSVDGTKLFVEYAHLADLVLCAARSKDNSGQQGITLFLVDAKHPNLTVIPIDAIAGDKQFQVTLNRVRIPQGSILGEVHKGGEYLQKLLQVATVAKCAEMTGGAQQVLDMTVDYVKQRVQFDHPIGSLQAIQHHCANMLIDLEGMKYVTYLAAWKVNEGLPFGKEAAVAKVWTSEAYRRISDLAHQCHGAIGFCEDHDLPLYSKRAKASEFAFGDARFQRQLVAREIGL
ncbi:MAG: acyl-CoA dehydrogenase [Chloroflexi bacterium]|nr:acyl-CoA dehydrogenase [Chloroflexota bacterium]